jgi:ABC-type glycerol-3-phosphate transport system substrate-binding protein
MAKIKKTGRRAISAVLALAMGLTGCGQTKALQGAYENEIITTEPVDQKKTVVTVRVEFGAGQQENLEQVLEQQFPNVDIVLRHDGSTNSVYTIQANLEAGVECDLILSRRLPVAAEVVGDYLLDLSAEPFVDSYYLSAVESCADENGKIFYLPGPSDVYGIVYNKTMFDTYGWELPGSYTEFLELLDTIRQTDTGDTDIKPIQPSLMYPDMFQILFNTYGYESVYSGSENFLWLSAYEQGVGSMVGHMEPAVDIYKKLFADGILSVDDLEVSPSDRSEMMYAKHSTAMIIECQNAITYAQNYLSEADSADEFSMMPFWTSDKADGDYLYAIPSYYMAINRSSTLESDEKKQLLLDIYSYLSSVEGQEMLMGDDFQLSNIEGVPMNENTFSEGILDTIERGQIINTFYLADGETTKQVERQMMSTTGDLIDGSMSTEEWLLAADAVRDQWLAGELNQETVYGQVQQTMTRLETAYTMAEMYRSMTGAEIGICRGGGWDKSTNGYLYQGDITDSLLECLTPAKEETEEENGNRIMSARMTGQEILDILNSTGDWLDDTTKGTFSYYVAAGLDVKMNPWGEDGQRVISCKLADGSKLDPEALYTVAYFNGSVKTTGEDAQALDMTWQDAFLKWLDGKGGVLEKPDMTLTLDYQL